MRNKRLIWHRLTLPFVLMAGTASGDTITLNVFHSPNGINWRSPASLTRSAMFSEIGNEAHSIGHVDVRIDCEPTSDRAPVNEATGMTGASDEETRQVLFRDQEGLGILFHTFSGRLRSSTEVISEEIDFWGSWRLAQLIFSVSPETCQRSARYVNEYRQLGYEQFYGTANRPRYREGAGCSAFAASVLDVAGILPFAAPAAWNLELLVPARFVGGPLTGYSVPVRRILISPFGVRWAFPSEPHFQISVWDPDRLHQWIIDIYAGQLAGPALPWSAIRTGDTRIITMDATRIPTPQDDFWKGSL